MLIEVYPKSFTKWNKSRQYFLNKVMAHEFAHLIDMLARGHINGNWSTTDPDVDHDEFWQCISKACGGNTDGDGLIPVHV